MVLLIMMILTYGDIFSTIKKLGINMCNDKIEKC